MRPRRPYVHGMFRSLVLAALVANGERAAAATLALDGGTAAVKTLGGSLEVAIGSSLAPPAAPVFLLADATAGPTTILGQSLPLGFTPALAVLPFGSLGAGGSLVVSLPLPAATVLDGITIHLLAAVASDAASAGIEFSNGASLTLLARPAVAATQATLVGRRVVLAAADYANPDGSLPPGTQITWSIVSAPSGSAATVADPFTAYASLVPDRAGDYLVRAAIQTPSFATQQTATVHAWQIATSPFQDGAISFLPSFPLSGSIAGPAILEARIDGQPLALGAGNSFGPLPVTFADGLKARRTFELMHPDGSTTAARFTYFQGIAQPLASASAKSLAAQLGNGALDRVEVLGEAELATADIEGLLLAQPPQQVANEEGPFGFTFFSATIDFTNLSYAPAIDLQLAPTAAGLVATVRIFDVRADFEVAGEVFEVDYDLDGYITTSPTTITATLQGAAVNGVLDIAVSNVVVDRANFDFELNGFVGTVAEAFVIESAVKEDVEAAIAQTVANELPPAIEAILGSFVLAGSLASVLDVDVQVAAPIAGVVHSSHGVTIQLDGKASAGVAEPGSPTVVAYRATPAPPVAFSPLTPTGQPYGAALAVADDFVNQVLAAATAAGLLDGDLTSLFPASASTPLALTTDQLAILFPDCGFDPYPIGTEVKLRAHGTVPPILALTPSGASDGIVVIENLEVEFEVAASQGAVPTLLVSISGEAGVDLALEPDGSLGAAIGASTLAIELLRPFPGTDFQFAKGQTQFLGVVFDFALPQLLEAIGQIPLPSLAAQGLSLAPTEVAPLPPAGAHLGFFGDLVVR
jgi:hypothetical protein